MIDVNGVRAHLDFVLLASDSDVIAVSFYDRSLQTIRSIGATLNKRGWFFRKITTPRDSFAGNDEGFNTFIAPVVYGKEKFYHCIAVNRALNKKYLVSDSRNLYTDFYNLLMGNFELPLLTQWSESIFTYGRNNREILQCNRNVIYGRNSHSSEIALGKDKLQLKELVSLRCDFTEKSLENAVSSLLEAGSIHIAETPQKPLAFTDMDGYFQKYGHTLVENLEKQITPLTELNGNIDNLCLRNKRLYPQQAAQVNAVVNRLRHNSYAILNNGMGTGKTLEGASIVEAYFVEKWLRKNPGKSLRDAYLSDGIINYRCIIMCPGHLVEKWAAEIGSEIPYAKVTILRDISQVTEIKAKKFPRNGKEIYVISKDFAKLSYQSKPLPRKRRYGQLLQKKCVSCGSFVNTIANECSCGCKKLELVPSHIYANAMVCPCCKNLLIPYKTNSFTEDTQTSLDFDSFTAQNTSNSKCFYCGESLWVPHVPNIGENKHDVWYRATHYSNKAHKGTKSVWVHKNFDKEYFDLIQEEPLRVIEANSNFGIRKVSPASFISKQLKGYFDFAIFDEAHLYKGAGTAQGNTMHALVKASKKQLALTGTIAGGYASHLFFLLYRLDPSRMKKKGYQWNDVMEFVDKYGQVETVFESSENNRYNTSSKGKQIGSPKEKPGISPLIFTDFLLDSSVFLDLSDMSKYLPALKEVVIDVDIPRMEEDEFGNVVESVEFNMLQHYRSVIDSLKKQSKEKGGRALLSSLLQFSLSYLDHPYDAEVIKNGFTGATVVEPDSFDCFASDKLLTKERKLIELVKKELDEDRNCFVFAEYTGSPHTCVTYRLKKVLMEHCDLKEHEVIVLESTFPCASEREDWMHKKAKAGAKVFITNPRNVETGLDFCFLKDGVLYNYPTLIFYQLGYSLFTIWQASRRHYRLNQREECRTYYMAINGTVQQTIISLIAQKMAATSAIQGKFSAEGLSSMAQGIDVKLKLAQALSSMDETSGANLQKMFDVLQGDSDDNEEALYGKYRQMLTFSELIGDQLAASVASDASLETLLSVFDTFEDGFLDSFFGDTDFVSDTPMLVKATEPASVSVTPVFGPLTKKERKKVPQGQISLFFGL